MKNNFENIPSGIFDWIMMYAFDELTATQQAEVLQYLDRETYNDMYATVTGMAGLKNIPAANGKMHKKQVLLESYDTHHQSKKGFVWFMHTSVALWKAAAIVVLLLSGWVYFYMAGKKENPDQLVAKVDTVYVTKEIPVEPVKVHDTIYITKYATKNKKDTAFKIQVPVMHNGTLPVNETTPGIVPVETLENRTNQPKGNSMKDDTLLKKFSFVTM